MAAKIHKTFLSFLTHLSFPQLKSIISRVTKPQITAIRELVVNLVNGNFNLSEADLKKLRPFKRFLRAFAKRPLARCMLNKKCRAIYNVLKAGKKVIDQL